MVNIFIGYDYRERAAANVLCDSIWRRSSMPVSISQMVTQQYEEQGLFWRQRHAKQSTEFSFTRFLVPHLMGFKGWALFMDCDMLCRDDIAKVWALRDERYALMVTQHDHQPTETVKLMGEPQTAYPRKNWSSFMLFNCAKCTQLTPDYVNSASGLDLHRFNWLAESDEIGEIPVDQWNYLIGVQGHEGKVADEGGPSLVHWTLGGPWFPDYRGMANELDLEWFRAREDAFSLWK